MQHQWNSARLNGKFRGFARIGLLMLFLLLVSVVVVPIAAQDTTPVVPPQVGLRPDAPPYALHGPYWVGVRDYSIAEGENHFWVTVWYPALNPDGAPEEMTYFTSAEWNVSVGFPADFEGPITGHALANAVPDTRNGPYPLVINSPGLLGYRQQSSYLMEHLASYGFVVVSMEHSGETIDVDGAWNGWGGAYSRPTETQLAIQYADQLTAAGGDLEGLIDVDTLAVMGVSSGGWTALVGGGAQMNLSGCPTFLSQADGAGWVYDCTEFAPHQDEIAALYGLDAAPEGAWPQSYDARVDAVIALDADGDIWGSDYSGVTSVTVPTMVFGSTGDTSNVPEHSSIPIYAHLGSTVKTHVVFENAEHGVSINSCTVVPWLGDLYFYYCADPVWDKDRAHDLVSHFTTAFLLDILKGDADAHAALAAEAVSFPGITYEAQGF